MVSRELGLKSKRGLPGGWVLFTIAAGFLVLFTFPLSAGASHICIDPFTYDFSIVTPYQNQHFAHNASIEVHVDLDSSSCFNAMSADYNATYDGVNVASGSFPRTGTLDSDVYFTISSARVISQGSGTKEIRVKINTSDACGAQNFIRTRNVIVDPAPYSYPYPYPTPDSYPYPYPTPDSSPVGYHDGNEGAVESSSCFAGGWSYDPDGGNPIDVHVYVGGPAGSGSPGYATKADKPRPDVCNAIPGAPCNAGFHYNLPSQFHDGSALSIYTYGINAQGGHNPLLNGSPKNLTCLAYPYPYPYPYPEYGYPYPYPYPSYGYPYPYPYPNYGYPYPYPYPSYGYPYPYPYPSYGYPYPYPYPSYGYPYPYPYPGYGYPYPYPYPGYGYPYPYPTPPTLILDFKAIPATINPGTHSTLFWSTSNADSCDISDDNPDEPDLGGVPVNCNPPGCPNSQDTVSPITDTTYTLTCSGPGGTTADDTTVNIRKVPTFEEIPPE